MKTVFRNDQRNSLGLVYLLYNAPIVTSNKTRNETYLQSVILCVQRSPKKSNFWPARLVYISNGRQANRGKGVERSLTGM